MFRVSEHGKARTGDIFCRTEAEEEAPTSGLRVGMPLRPFEDRRDLRMIEELPFGRGSTTSVSIPWRLLEPGAIEELLNPMPL